MGTLNIPYGDYSIYKPKNDQKQPSAQPVATSPIIAPKNNFEKSYSAASSAIYASALGGINYQTQKNKVHQSKTEVVKQQVSETQNSTLSEESYQLMKKARTAIAEKNLAALTSSVDEMAKSDLGPTMASSFCVAMANSPDVSKENKEILLEKAFVLYDQSKTAQFELAKFYAENGKTEEAKTLAEPLKNEQGKINLDTISEIADDKNLMAMEYNYTPTTTANIKADFGKILGEDCL